MSLISFLPEASDSSGGVDSVNGYTGVVSLNASDVGALSSSTVVSNVYQISTSTNSDYPILFSGTTSTSTKTANTRFNSSFSYNPNTKTLKVPEGGRINIPGKYSTDYIAISDDLQPTYPAQANTNNSVAIGPTASAYKAWSVGIGYNAYSDAMYSTSIGCHTQVKNSTMGIALGGFSNVFENCYGGIAIGYSANVYANCDSSIAIGSMAVVKNTTDGIAILGKATDGGAIGIKATANGTNTIAIGGTINGNDSVGIGCKIANYSNVTLVGINSKGSGSNSVSIGYNSSSSYNSVSIGYNSSSSSFDVVIGYNSKGSQQSVSIGYNSNASTSSVTIGNNTNTGSLYSIAIGDNSSAEDQSSVVVGSNSTTKQTIYSIAIGCNSGTKSTEVGINLRGGTAIGAYSQYNANYSTALGYGTKASAINSTAIGANASCSEANTIQLGNASSLSKLTCKVQLTVSSDTRDKTDITSLESNKSLDFINELNPVQFVYNQRELYKNEYKKYNDDLPDDYIPEPTYDENGELIPLPERPINPKWQEVEDIRSKYPIYDYDEEEWSKGTKKGERKRVGLLSQEVQQALIDVYGSADVANIVDDSWHDLTPEERANIPEGAENSLTMAYSNLIPMMIGAIKELSAEVKELKNKVYE